MLTLDKLVIAWAIWLVCSSLFHHEIVKALIYRLGLAYDGLGLYFLLRIFIPDGAAAFRTYKIVLIALIPVAMEMMFEAATGRDLFSFFGGVPFGSEIRNGKVRAQGPFTSSILAGTVGGVCLPVAISFWKKDRKLALVGCAATAAMAVTSRSSGPVMTAIIGVFAIVLWKFRRYMKLIRWSAVLGIIALAMVMNAPVYYLMDRIDFTGSSTGWHRSALIEAAIDHLNEWWFSGTDYTRHWLSYTGGSTENDTDITNHYIRTGVWGGLPLVLLLVAILLAAFKTIGKTLRQNRNAPPTYLFFVWALGASLFGHAATMISVSYFDQSIFFFYLVLAAIAAVYAGGPLNKVRPNDAALAAMDRQVRAGSRPLLSTT